tara:strand:+ start:145 stop:354 length:210 start_codon:yes stop_codon:yes gene_type:complete
VVTVVDRRSYGRRSWGAGPWGEQVPAGGVAQEVSPKVLQRLRKQQNLRKIIKDDEEITTLIMLATLRGS